VPEHLSPSEGGAALRARLNEITSTIVPGIGSVDSLTTMQLLAILAASVRRDLDKSRYWLLMCAVAGAMPIREELMRGFRVLELADEGFEHYAVLEGCAGMASFNPNFGRPITLRKSVVIVDVDFSARHGHNTGIQRVVRETVRRWNGEHAIEMLVWTEEALNFRALVPEEKLRVVDWNSSRILEWSPPTWDESAEIVIPWDCTIILPEVAQHRVWERLACMAEFSCNRIALVGYDAIPVSSAEYVIPSETDRFVRYLSVVKHADVVLGISESSSEEFAGFSAALRAQNLKGPEVITVSLPVDLPAREHEVELPPRDSNIPLVVCVGTQEPRKNQLAVLAAADRLWREGAVFELLFIGSAAMPLSIPFDVELERLQREGRAATVLRGGSDALLERSYRDARFSIFVSMHEGYGLPVGESLAAGTPVITTNFGSTAEIAKDGGCLVVDPRDDDAIAEAMRKLLDDDELLAGLVAEAAARPGKTWDAYAEELWNTVMRVEGSE
jgi:glycosyltransferase involved in cell wall biosynthesis